MSGDETLAPVIQSVNDHEGTSEEPSTPRAEKPYRLTMEVPFFFMFFAVSISGAVTNNLLLHRTCTAILGYNETFCDSLQASGEKTNETQHLESEVQKYTTIITMCKAVLEGFFPAVLSMFLGVWSNKYGRKPLVVWPLFGFALSSILVVIYSQLDGLSPWWYVGSSVPYSLGGGGSALFTGAFCYISDISSEENRSFRLSMLEAALFGGGILGSLASPFMVEAIGTTLLLLFTAALAVFAYVYTNIWVPESVAGARSGGLGTVLDISLVKDMFNTCFRKRPNYDRAILLLIAIPNCMAVFVLYGLFNIDYLYTREKLQWTLKDYSYFTAINTVVMVLGLLFGVSVLQKRFKVSDVVMTSVAFISSIVDVMTRALATKSWHMYFGSTISLLRGLISPLIRSIISKRVTEEDVAKVFALISAIEAILPVFSPIVYSGLYTVTLTTLPGAVYLMTALIYGVCLIITWVVQFLMARYPQVPYTTLQS